MPEHANDNDTEGSVEQNSAISKHISEADDARRILRQFSKLINDEAAE
jgi:hypothetical protein